VSDEVMIVPYDAEWPILFARLGCALRAALGDVALRIDHVGSTSVAGLDAKIPHVWEIMAKADRWSQEVGWEPGPTDA
jgi:GrpB-like predicted nucleotidyltransferase (UPF0157 family)